ncbi:hypothetical protein C0J52_17606 [Blattella germanica]|nr:hypothetical protein C0J52_17606 [Blattella germanica]
MMHQVCKTLPDDRPITSINIIEDPDKCPRGFIVVSRTHDQDSDADLWREASFFGKKWTRYICLSKTEGITDYIVDRIAIISEKDMPPDGYAVVARTADSEQKAWRKRQLCYRLVRRSQATGAVTDIIIMSRTKRAPAGFIFAGLSPAPTYLPHSQSPQPKVASIVPKAPTDGISGEDSPHEYEQLISLRPSRPAPKPPGGSSTSYATIAAYSGMFSSIIHQYPVVKSKTKYQLDKEYDYDFRIERET